jgi:3-methylfumaryl-CoA hydratase
VPALDPAALAAWVGRTETRTDRITERVAQLLAATLDRKVMPAVGAALPPLWHWTHFVPDARTSELGPDGHPKRGRFLPPVPLPRRMWAGGRFTFEHPLFVGEKATRRSTIRDVTVKSGKSGTLVFVKVVHAIEGETGHALTEEQDIVYREEASSAPPTPPAAPEGAKWSDEIAPDPVLLFRYSALTFNSHRIHYDHPYATDAEGYPGLVVHGPLIATLLAESLGRRTSRVLSSFAFRAVSPLIAPASFTLNGRIEGDRAALWAANSEGRLAMSAEAELT